MNQMKLAAAMIAATGAAGAANATVTVISGRISADQGVADLTIGGSNVFTYGSTVVDNGGKNSGHTGDGGILTAINGSGIGGFSATATMPTVGESFATTSVILSSVADNYDGKGNHAGHTYSLSTPGGDEYLHIKFTDTAGPQVGYLTLDNTGSILSITYQAVPEPAAWALMFSGMALTGGALRRSRRQARVPLAA